MESNKIKAVKNTIDVMENIDDIDNKLEGKYRKNCMEILFYKKILDEATDSLKNISKNLS